MFRIAEGEHVSDDITVVTKFRLTNGQDNVQADIVIWGGREWTVIALEDFSEYGEGFIAAHCRKRTLND